MNAENVGRLCEEVTIIVKTMLHKAQKHRLLECIREAVDEFSTCELEHTPKKSKPTQESNQQQKEEL